MLRNTTTSALNVNAVGGQGVENGLRRDSKVILSYRGRVEVFFGFMIMDPAGALRCPEDTGE